MMTTKPCPHMKVLLSALADGSLDGIARWYAEKHASQCPRCGESLASLKVLRERIRTLGVPESEPLHLPDERWQQLEAAWERVDQQTTESR